MSRITRIDTPLAADPRLVLAMLANRIPLVLLPDLAWPRTAETADFTPIGTPC